MQNLAFFSSLSVFMSFCVSLFVILLQMNGQRKNPVLASFGIQSLKWWAIFITI